MRKIIDFRVVAADAFEHGRMGNDYRWKWKGNCGDVWMQMESSPQSWINWPERFVVCLHSHQILADLIDNFRSNQRNLPTYPAEVKFATHQGLL